MRSWEHASSSRPSTTFQLPLPSAATGKPNCRPSGTPYSPRLTTATQPGKVRSRTASANNGTNYGVYGTSLSASGYAVYSNGRFKATGRTYLGAPATAPADADLNAGSVSLWLDETNNALKVRVKYANGTTLKAGTIALA